MSVNWAYSYTSYTSSAPPPVGSAVSFLPQRLIKKILDQEYIDMVELIPDSWRLQEDANSSEMLPSTNEANRCKQEKGVRKRVTGCKKIQTKGSFVQDENNKTELFHCLAHKIAEMHTKNVVTVTNEELVLSSKVINLDHLAPYSQDIKRLKKFVIAKYDRSRSATCVNNPQHARNWTFARKHKSYRIIPPTRAAYVQYLMHSAYQAGCI